MKADEPRGEIPFWGWLIIFTVGIFFLQNVAERWFDYYGYLQVFALSPDTVRQGYVWTIVTYPFLHSTQNLFHILVNMFVLFFLSRAVYPLLQKKAFCLLFFGTAVLGGIVWLVVNYHSNIPVVGASAAVFGLLVFFAFVLPDQRITFLLFFIIPITLKPKYLVYGLLAFDIFGFLFSELPHNGISTSIAHSAHLGGMLGGWLFYRFIYSRARRQPGRPAYRPQPGAKMELPEWFKKKAGQSRPAPRYRVNVTNRQDLQNEVDRILDKINSEGFGALSEEEKRTLDKAKDLLNR